MALKYREPEVVTPSKPKFLLSGESGVGKTMFSLRFESPFLIDTEGGATREQYQALLKESGGAYFGKDEGSQSFITVIDTVKTLATTKHKFKTLIIDSVSHIYLLEAAAAEAKGGSEFGRDKKIANQPVRQLLSWIDKLDMVVILIAHSKTKWTRHNGQIVDAGSTFDFYDKTEYLLDIWAEIQRGGKSMIIKKSRIQSLPQDSMIPVEYSKFADVYGKDVIEREVKPLILSSEEQVTRVNLLVSTLQIAEDTIEKWYKKCDVDSFVEMTSEQIQGCIAMLEKRVDELNTKKEK